MIDGLRINNWQRTESASKKPPRNVPDPFPRPRDNEKSQRSTAEVGDTAQVGNTIATVTTVSDFMARRAEREKRWRDKNNTQGGEG